MAEQVIINKSILTDIGNAIREKKGTTALIPTSEMASEIEGIETWSGGSSAPRLKSVSVKYGQLIHLSYEGIQVSVPTLTNISTT